MRRSKAISTTEGSEQRAELAKLTEEYKFYTNFDLLGTREYRQANLKDGTRFGVGKSTISRLTT
jgi:hypothetical protein